MESLDKIKSEEQKITEELKKVEASSDWEKIGKLKKQQEIYKSIIKKQEGLEEINRQAKDVEKILNTEKDAKLLSLAEEEKKELLKKRETAEREMKKILKEINGNGEEPNSAIIEIRAGAGGEEAALFASNLFNMYSKYAEIQNWQTKILNSHRTELGGYKEIAFQISGPEAFSKMKLEAGVHRVQRIQPNENKAEINNELRH